MTCECISYNQPQPNQSVPERVLTPPASLNLGRDTVCVDACIVEQVEALWSAGVVTLSACCGHNDDAKRHVVVAPEHADLANAALAGFDRPLPVYQADSWQAKPQDDFPAAIAEFKSALPGWWYSVGECQVSCDASCAPTTESEHINLIQVSGDRFDAGFHVDIPQPSTLAEALRNVMRQALSEIENRKEA